MCLALLEQKSKVTAFLKVATNVTQILNFKANFHQEFELGLFYKIINNLAMMPRLCLEKADGRTRKKHNLKFRHIGYNVDPYGQSFFPKCISTWNGLAQEIAEANTLDLFKSKLAH